MINIFEKAKETNVILHLALRRERLGFRNVIRSLNLSYYLGPPTSRGTLISMGPDYQLSFIFDEKLYHLNLSTIPFVLFGEYVASNKDYIGDINEILMAMALESMEFLGCKRKDSLGELAFTLYRSNRAESNQDYVHTEKHLENVLFKNNKILNWLLREISLKLKV